MTSRRTLPKYYLPTFHSSMNIHSLGNLMKRKYYQCDEINSTNVVEQNPTSKNVEIFDKQKKSRKLSGLKPYICTPSTSTTDQAISQDEASPFFKYSDCFTSELTSKNENLKSDSKKKENGATKYIIQNHFESTSSHSTLQSQHNYNELNLDEKLPFNIPQYLVSQRSDLILDEMKESQTFEDAHRAIKFHINEFLALIESHSNEFLNSENDQGNPSFIPASKVSDIIKERDQSILRAHSLDLQLKKEQSSSCNKDTQIEELQSELCKKDSLLTQVNEWIQEYFRTQSLQIHKNCGFNERLPPDVF